MKISRRDWLLQAAGGLVALHFLGCRFWARDELSYPPGWVFGHTVDPSDPKHKSFLYVADFAKKQVTRASVPVYDAHKVIPHWRDRKKLFVIGLESPTACLYNLETRQVEQEFRIDQEGYVSSGHATYTRFRGEDAVLTTEYRLRSPEKGTVAIRRLSDFSLLHRVENVGSYPHVVVFRPDQKDFVVQNLGHKAGNESYSPTAILSVYDLATLKVKKRVAPGREDKSHVFTQERMSDTEENKKFRRYVSYQVDSRTTFFPRQKVLANEHPDFRSFSIWEAETKTMRREVKLGDIVPLHSQGSGTFPYYVLYGDGSGLHLIDRNNFALTSPEEFREFRSNMHITLLEPGLHGTIKP